MAEWWKYVSESIPEKKTHERQTFYQKIVTYAMEHILGKDRIPGILKAIEILDASAKDLKLSVDCKSLLQGHYYTRIDPTIRIAGLNSGRPQEFPDPLTVKRNHEMSNDKAIAHRHEYEFISLVVPVYIAVNHLCCTVIHKLNCSNTQVL